MKTLLGNCLPGTPYDVVVEHAIQHERAREIDGNDKGEKKSSKRKADDLDVAEDIDEAPTKKKQFNSQAVQSIKDLVKEQLNSLREKMEYHFSSQRPTFYDKPKTSTDRACLYCAKPNHSYTECRSASAADKNAITQLLRAKKYDFARHHERAELFLKNRSNRFTDKSLETF